MCDGTLYNVSDRPELLTLSKVNGTTYGGGKVHLRFVI